MTSGSQSDVAIVFGITRELAPAVGSVLLDLVSEKIGRNFDVHIFHDGISKRNKKTIKRIVEAKFIKYKPQISRVTKTVPSVRQFTPMVFSKYECLKLLKDYETVLWLDCDIIVQLSIDELFQYRDADMVFVSGGRPVREQFVEPIENYDMDRESMSAGVIVFNRNRLSGIEYEYCFQQTEKYNSNLLMPEQGIFDLMIQDFGLTCVELSNETYACHPLSPNRNSAKILHAFGQPKFWNGRHHNHWEENSKVWISLGGSPYRSWNWIRRVKRKSMYVGNRLLIKLARIQKYDVRSYTYRMIRDFAKYVFKGTSRLLDSLPVGVKWRIAQLMPIRLRKPFMKYGRTRDFEWKVGTESSFTLRSDFEDDYFELSYTETYGSYEPETLSAWEQITKKKKLVLDVGAYTGVFSLIASRKDGSLRCVAFEPNPVSYGKLVENIDINNAAHRVKTINVGLGERAGHISLVVPALRTGSSAVQLKTSMINRDTQEWLEIRDIKIDTIDSVLSAESNSVDAIKIDVEGYELNVLKGATERLKSDKPIILLECLSFLELEEISKFLETFGYSLEKSLDGDPMTEHLNESINDLTRARNYIFNHRG